MQLVVALEERERLQGENAVLLERVGNVTKSAQVAATSGIVRLLVSCLVSICRGRRCSKSLPASRHPSVTPLFHQGSIFFASSVVAGGC